jgi:putative ABC transport system permease protein
VRLLQLLSWPYFRKHVLRTALTAAGVVLGVAVFVGMHTANRSVLTAFSRTIDQIAGKTELQITAGEAGFGEDILEKVQAEPYVRVAVPVIEAVVETSLSGQGDLLVIGVDMTGDRSLRDYDLEDGDNAIMEDPLIFLAQPDSLIVSRELATRHGLGLGGRIQIETAEGRKAFTIRGIMKPSGLATAFGGNLAIMDVFAAQHMFGRGRTFDRIDLALTADAKLDEAQRQLGALLGTGFDVQAPASRGRQAQAMVAGYTMMVNVSSVFALFIGMFIIYNAFATAVAERRADIGVLRTLGASRAQVRWLFLSESMIIGLLGSAAGLGVGILLAQIIASAIGALVGQLYGVAQQAGAVATDPAVLALGLLIGVLTSLVATVIPAWNAARIDPIKALKKADYQMWSVAENRRRLSLALGLAVV